MNSKIAPLKAARPTAINLLWAVNEMMAKAEPELSWQQWVRVLLNAAGELAEEEVARSRKIGALGADIIHALQRDKPAGAPLNILTHCNAGWLATIDYGLATAPVYVAQERQIPIHVWVDETRPRLQGARLTAFELTEQGVPCALIADNAAGYLMQQGKVDMVIVGTDRTTRKGDVINKVGTYLKALAAKAHNIPFYVALPYSSVDWEIDSVEGIPIEERAPEEITLMEGHHVDTHKLETIRIAPKDVCARNIAFDITPRHLVTGFITENGLCAPNEAALRHCFSK